MTGEGEGVHEDEEGTSIKGAAELELGGMGVAGPSRKVILENLLPSATKSY